MLALPSSPVPTIEISFAPPIETQPEPFSPFTPANASFRECNKDVEDEGDAYRPALLTPPPIHAPGMNMHFGGFAMKKQGQGHGIGEAEFSAMLRASKERSAAAASRRQQDLRKEVTLKAHKNKQLERRARFLSKLGAPPSPSAVSLPKTPPDSPAIFHYSLPSPGLCSPLALFEMLGLENEDGCQVSDRKAWVEQIDFRLPASRCMPPSPSLDASREKHALPSISVTQPSPKSPQGQKHWRPGHARKTSLPSLEQITGRYSERAALLSSPPTSRSRAPLPAFLNARGQTAIKAAISEEREKGHEMVETGVTETLRPRPMRLASTGRIQFPARSSPSPPAPPKAAAPAPSASHESPCALRQPRKRALALSNAPASPMPPKMPVSPATKPTIQVTPTHVGRAASSLSSFTLGSGIKLRRASLTEANLAALDSRARTARDMLSAVRRRTTVVCPSASSRVPRRSRTETEKLQFGSPVSPRPPVHTSLVDGAAEMLRKLGALAYASEYEKMQRRNSAPAELIATGKRTGAAFSHPVLALPGGF